jgi:hypothetical protein
MQCQYTRDVGGPSRASCSCQRTAPRLSLRRKTCERSPSIPWLHVPVFSAIFVPGIVTEDSCGVQREAETTEKEAALSFGSKTMDGGSTPLV